MRQAKNRFCLLPLFLVLMCVGLYAQANSELTGADHFAPPVAAVQAASKFTLDNRCALSIKCGPESSTRFSSLLYLNVSVGAFQKLDRGYTPTSQKRRNAASPTGSRIDALGLMQRDIESTDEHCIVIAVTTEARNDSTEIAQQYYVPFEGLGLWNGGFEEVLSRPGKSLYLRSNQLGALFSQSRTRMSAAGFAMSLKGTPIP
ncbi:MAG TPA: hypothetical protein VG267_06795 [Terracidiphilus sp.]|nr:hypothetical protein [Terracidiphilus sp.]